MGGFRKESNNTDFGQNLFRLIITHISQCCEKMKNDCRGTGNYLYNHEDKISNQLVERYLNASFLGLRFILQKPEHYDSESGTYKGRPDITVVSFDWFMNPDAYYLIECKRINGEKDLNRKYVSDGISRFIISPSPKYSSYYSRNIMLGYIVKTININDNTAKIDILQHELLADVTIGEMRLMLNDGKGFWHYQCLYQSTGNVNVELAHLFYDFSGVMREKS